MDSPNNEVERRHLEMMAATIAAGLYGKNPEVNPGWVDVTTPVEDEALRLAREIQEEVRR